MNITWKNILDQIQRLGHLSDEEFEQNDYAGKCVAFANNALLDLASTNGREYGTLSFVQTPCENMIDIKEDEIYRHENEDIVFDCGERAKAFYFECDGEAEVFIDGESGNIISLSVSSDRAFKSYRGFIKNTSDKNVKIRFSGPYAYNVRNVAAYDSIRSDVLSDIPQFGKYTVYDIEKMTNGGNGTRFLAFSDANIVKHNGAFLSQSEYALIDNHTLALPRKAEGEFTVYYIRYPAQLPEDIPPSETIDIHPQFATLIPLFVASFLYADETPSVASDCYNKYISMKTQLFSEQVSEPQWSYAYRYER